VVASKTTRRAERPLFFGGSGTGLTLFIGHLHQDSGGAASRACSNLKMVICALQRRVGGVKLL
jgi:hypothetical protein